MLRTALRQTPLRAYSRPTPLNSKPWSHNLNSHRHFSTRSSSARPHSSQFRRCLQAEARSPILLPTVIIGGCRTFHSTPRNQGAPFIGVLAGILKTSTALEMARTAVRIALTFVPIILLKNHKSKRFLSKAEQWKIPDLDAKKDMIIKGIRHRTILFHVLLFAPFLLFWATIIASLERTPLTGRWRLILLSPEEEDDIAAQLAGPGWYHAVTDILTKDGDSPQLIPTSDWRLSWVNDTLRRLERVIPHLQCEGSLEPKWLDCGPDDVPFPPPAKYPLRPRPRASEYLRRFCAMACSRTPPTAPHVIPGPPYSLIVVDKPDSSNAFSYGFGPEGGGGIVVFSGFIDDVLAKHPLPEITTPEPPEPSWWNALFGSLFNLSPSPPSYHPQPTEEQTSELAILLAHELAHLILSHHLETLSSSSIIWPGIVSIATDVVRAFLFPVTMLFGPFINDALAGIGKASTGEFTQVAEYCTSQHQEIEADIVSARLLAHAGFDPRHAVQFWEERGETERTAECSPATAKETFKDHEEVQEDTSKPMRWIGSTHPLSVVRIAKLKEELVRWEKQRAKAIKEHEARLRAQQLAQDK
ncbi:peptidase family M48-domain-containing protein [Abortiporus biennis]|nr:peptidase family M48-domain-containing protein [Abortiporus biennis]